MERLWTGDLLVEMGRGPRIGLQTRSSATGGTHEDPAVARARARVLQQFQLAQLVQHLAPNIHHWNRNTVFSIDRLRTDIGWEPRHTFASMVEDTYRWWHDAGLAGDDVDWTFEDAIVELLD